MFASPLDLAFFWVGWLALLAADRGRLQRLGGEYVTGSSSYKGTRRAFCPLPGYPIPRQSGRSGKLGQSGQPGHTRVSRVSRVVPELGLSLVDGFGVTRGTVVWYRVIRHSWANLLEQISISKISSRSLLCEIVSIELLGSNLCQLGDSGVQDGAYLVIAELHILLP